MSLKELKALVKAKKNVADPLFAVIVGCSSAGKSFLTGTLGVPTLFLYLSTEHHGHKAASSSNANILPVCLDVMEEQDKDIAGLASNRTGDRLNDTQSILKLKHYSSLDLKSEGIEAVVIDSLSDLEQVIKATPDFKQACIASNGKMNKFNEGDELIKRIREIVIGFQHFTKEGVHTIFTLAGVVQAVDENSAASIIQPKLSTFSVADMIPRLFSDVLLVTRMKHEGEMKHVLSFDGNFQRTGKDITGKTNKVMNFAPRVSGLSTDDLPEFMKADLKEVLKLKNKGDK